MSEPTGSDLEEERDAEQHVAEGKMDAEAELAEPEDTRVVRWYGQAGVDYREISDLEWKRAGVDLEKDADGNDRELPVSTIRWDKHNDYTVPLSALAFLTEEQVARYIGGDSRFRIEER